MPRPEIEEVAALVEAPGDLFGERLALERLLEQQRQLQSALRGAAVASSGRQRAANLAEIDREQMQRDQL